MAMPNQSRIAVLQRRRIRKERAAEAVAAWAVVGINVSVLSDRRHEQVVQQFREMGHRERATGSLKTIVAELGNTSEILVIIGWDIDGEPALLIPSDALVRAGVSFQTIYPEGFVAADQPLTRALIVDFDETEIRIDKVWFTGEG